MIGRTMAMTEPMIKRAAPTTMMERTHQENVVRSAGNEAACETRSSDTEAPLSRVPQELEQTG